MTALAERLKALIAAQGPIPVAEYMAIALSDPVYGYYTRRDPLGAAGDFITAPEVSQMFGELIGLWCLGVYEAMGRPERISLVELGPGRGTLMADLTRAARIWPEFGRATSVHLIEISPALRAKQAEKLSGLCEPVWHERIADVPDGPMIVVANEFFDALPMRQYQRMESGWHERVVGLGPDGELAIGLGATPVEAAGMPQVAGIGAIFEVSPAGIAVMGEIAHRFARDGGALLAVDYGHLEPGFGDSFQALRAHQKVPVLAFPGEADLTAHVDFSALARAAEAAGARIAGRTTQGEFLLNMGLLARAGQLGAGKDAASQDAIRAAVERLAGADAMGTLFKAMAVTSGFDVPGFGQESRL